MVQSVADPSYLAPVTSGDRGCDVLKASLIGTHGPAAAFLASLSDRALSRYHRTITEPRPEQRFGPAPHLLTATMDQIYAWLHAIWTEIEATIDDPILPVVPFDDWLAHAAEDDFYRHHLHAKFGDYVVTAKAAAS
ncbi:hypothetical protein ACOI1H_16395 [Loktanella sp. DJP18]|uniref:hypothetical protein n=1 Tax=Loktanella sp. DJP18 TaxID=3409788 RepID=UPI003BB7D196